MPTWYICQQCGRCCRWPGEVKLTDYDITRLARFLGMDEWTFIQRYTKISFYRTALALMDKPDGSCVFLDEQGRCSVYPARPKQCRDFPHRWRVPNLEQQCPAIPIEVSQQEYERRLREVDADPWMETESVSSSQSDSTPSPKPEPFSHTVP